jgi:hypothetical protein
MCPTDLTNGSRLPDGTEGADGSRSEEPLSFKTVLCVDGSAGDERKRPVYRVQLNGTPKIDRLADPKGVMSVLEDGDKTRFPRPLLITADVPIGVPEGYGEVLQDHKGFLPWLDSRSKQDWHQMVAHSVREQTRVSPFVDRAKGEKKASGCFPLRKCDVATKAESLYWCVGAKQVGKAALHFWQECLIPLREELQGDLAVWPFEQHDGKGVVVAECYPASLCRSVYGRVVKKTSASDVASAVYWLWERMPEICDQQTWLQAASSEDDFDMFSTAVALLQKKAEMPAILQSPKAAVPFEGWMLLLGDGGTGAR